MPEFYKYGKENNDSMIAIVVSSEDPDLDAAVDEKVNEEVKINALKGPYFDFGQLLQEHSETMEYVFVVSKRVVNKNATYTHTHTHTYVVLDVPTGLQNLDEFGHLVGGG